MSPLSLCFHLESQTLFLTHDEHCVEVRWNSSKVLEVPVRYTVQYAGEVYRGEWRLICCFKRQLFRKVRRCRCRSKTSVYVYGYQNNNNNKRSRDNLAWKPPCIRFGNIEESAELTCNRNTCPSSTAEWTMAEINHLYRLYTSTPPWSHSTHGCVTHTHTHFSSPKFNTRLRLKRI